MLCCPPPPFPEDLSLVPAKKKILDIIQEKKIPFPELFSAMSKSDSHQIFFAPVPPEKILITLKYIYLMLETLFFS